MHARRAIVSAAVTALTNLNTTADRIAPGRAWPVQNGDTPYLLVYAREERSDSDTMGGASRKLVRLLTLSIEGITAETNDTDDTLDQIALEVETALHSDPTLGGLCRDLYLIATSIDARANGDMREGRVRLDFLVNYRTAANAPGTSV